MIAFVRNYRPEPEPQPKYTKCLFIGGSLDGQRHLIKDDRSYVEAAVLPDLGLVFNLRTRFEDLAFRKVTYRRAALKGEQKCFTVFMLNDRDGDDLLSDLINGYQRTATKEHAVEDAP